MPFISNKTAKEEVNIYYEDYGSGQPVILIHGWPLSHKVWEGQVSAIVEAGFRCITYDRRGFGGSTQPWNGYDYDGLATDLHELISQLSLDNCVICGFSMGGGEVVRYLTNYGDSKISKAMLISSIVPLVKKKDDNPNGVPEEVLEGIIEAVQTDRPAFLKDKFHANFYNYDTNKDTVSEAKLEYDWQIALHASPRATAETAKAWAHTDFRPELKNVTVPTLIIHGDQDNVVPIATAGKQAAEGIKDNYFEIIKDGPHGLNVTHKGELNSLMLAFLKK